MSEPTTATMEEQQGTEDIGWAIVELLGHRRLAGYLSEQEIAGGKLLRVDVPSQPPATQFYSLSALYAITPTTEELARQIARRRGAHEPVSRWELPPAEHDEAWEGGS